MFTLFIPVKKRSIKKTTIPRLFLLTAVAVAFVSCGSQQSTDTNKKLDDALGRNVELRRNLDSLQDIINKSEIKQQQYSPVSTSIPDDSTYVKYVYVKVLTKEPTGSKLEKGTEDFYVSDGIGQGGHYQKGIPDRMRTTYADMVYTSDVQEINNITEDKKYALMDAYCKKVVGPIATTTKEILDRKCLVFDSYEAASKHKLSHKNEF